MIFACLFEHFILSADEIDLVTSDGFDISDDNIINNEVLHVINGTSFHFITIQNIVQRWDHFNKVKNDSDSSMNIFHAWETVLKDCQAGKELTGQHY